MTPAIDNEVLDAFLVEAGELLDALGDQLIALESEPRDGELLNSVFRTFHTVKGGAGFLNVRPMVELCHKAEELLNQARDRHVELEPPHIDCLLQASDTLQDMMQALRDGHEVPAASAELLQKLAPPPAADDPAGRTPSAVNAGDDDGGHCPPYASDRSATGVGDPVGRTPSAMDTCNDENARKAGDTIDDSEFEALLDSIYGKGGAPGVGIGDASVGANPPKAVIPATWRAGARPNSEAGPKGERHDGASKAGIHVDSASESKMDPGFRREDEQRNKHRADTTVRVDTGRIDALVNAAGELLLVRNRLANLTARGAGSEMERAVGNLDRVAGDLQTAALRMRMQPVGRLFQRFPRIVRDLARKLGKQVTLVQRGEDTHLDRTLVESLADPLVHLLRNAIDHGLEDPDARAEAGKQREGTVTLGAAQEGERVVITIRDDGRGMDPEVLRQKAIEKGLLSAEQARHLTPAECHALIFRPGFSTRTEISDISGRGVGMDVVKTSIANLGGTIEIESAPGRGTTIRIGIPLTLAILRVLMVRVGDRLLALPIGNVLEVFELHRAQMRMLDGQVTASHRGRPLPLSDLAAWAGVASAAHDRVLAVLVHAGHRQLGLLATEVLGREEVMIKPLGPHLRHLPGIAGATITGDGGIALVLDLVSLAEASLPPPLRMTA